MPTIRAADGGYLLDAEQFYYTKDEQRRPVMHIKGGSGDAGGDFHLPHYRLHEKSIYALYPSRRFLDAKVKTWVEFLKQEIPKVLEGHQAIVDDPAHWA